MTGIAWLCAVNNHPAGILMTFSLSLKHFAIMMPVNTIGKRYFRRTAFSICSYVIPSTIVTIVETHSDICASIPQAIFIPFWMSFAVNMHTWSFASQCPTSLQNHFIFRKRNTSLKVNINYNVLSSSLWTKVRAINRKAEIIIIFLSKIIIKFETAVYENVTYKHINIS